MSLQLPCDGIKVSPDVAQEIMEDVLRDIQEIDVCIDDVGVFGDSWEEHLRTLDRVLQRLQDGNFATNPLKCEWGVKETDWLGCWLTPHGLKPWRKKIDAIMHLDAPKNITQLRSFVGAATWCRDLFPKRSHYLAPLTASTGGKGKFHWTPECQKAFDAMKATLAREAFLRYPDHNKPFHIYTDASGLQLGATIMQEGKPVACFSRKLNSAQQKYATIEKELLSIMETFEEFRTMLYGCKELHVHTDHKNLTFKNLNSERVLHWRLYLEEHNPIFHYVKGENNSFADALSRLPFKEDDNFAVKQASSPSEHNNNLRRSQSSTFEDNFVTTSLNVNVSPCAHNGSPCDHEFSAESAFFNETQRSFSVESSQMKNDGSTK